MFTIDAVLPFLIVWVDFVVSSYIKLTVCNLVNIAVNVVCSVIAVVETSTMFTLSTAQPSKLYPDFVGLVGNSA